MTELTHLYSLPEGLLETEPETVHNHIEEATLVHLSGRRKQPLFISVLLHGNEPTGFYALQRLLQKYQDKPLPRSISLFFGNVNAAKYKVRHLENQPDFNRIWPGGKLPESAESRMIGQIYEAVLELKPLACIDIHNNTGTNPHYACISKLDNRFLQLAALFGKLVVYFSNPKGVQSIAFTEHFPSITLECGRPDQQYGIDHAFEFLNSCLNLEHLSETAKFAHDLDIYRSVAQIKINPDVSISFNDTNADLFLYRDLDTMNFIEAAPGTGIGKINRHKVLPIRATNDNGEIVTEKYFQNIHDELQFKTAIMPSMLTLDEKIIEQDCLCYLMEKMSL